MTTRADDERFMARAIEVSLRHQGQTLTNPSVGCVLVKDGKIIAEAARMPSGRRWKLPARRRVARPLM